MRGEMRGRCASDGHCTGPDAHDSLAGLGKTFQSLGMIISEAFISLIFRRPAGLIRLANGPGHGASCSIIAILVDDRVRAGDMVHWYIGTLACSKRWKRCSGSWPCGLCLITRLCRIFSSGALMPLFPIIPYYSLFLLPSHPAVRPIERLKPTPTTRSGAVP